MSNANGSPSKPKDHRTEEDGQQLCLACGMCCRGDLYRNAGISPEDVPSVRALGLSVIQDDPDRPAFRLPCPKLDGNFCTVYEDERKPHVCSSFQCMLLKRYLRDDIGTAQSLEYVRQARSLIDQLRAETGRDAEESIWIQLSESSKSDSTRKNEVRMQVGALMHLLTKTFLPPVDRRDLEAWPPTLED